MSTEIVMCDVCGKRPATQKGLEVVAEEMGHKQYGEIDICDHCAHEPEPVHDTWDEHRGLV